MYDAFEAIEYNNNEVFLIYDDNQPENAIAIMTTSDFIEFLYRDIWCNSEKRRNKLKDLLESYGKEMNKETLDCIQNQPGLNDNHNNNENDIKSSECKSLIGIENIESIEGIDKVIFLSN